MRPPQIRASFDPGDLVLDLFAGGGGASTGIKTALGRSPDIAINHDAAAIAMHAANHPKTRHYIEDVFAVDPREACGGRPVGLLWASPDCTHHSRAKGSKPRESGKRALADVVIRWAREVGPRLIVLENVEEWLDWGPLEDGYPIKARAGEFFRAWRAALVDLDYAVDFRTLVAADYGAPTSRRRLYLLATRGAVPIIWPEATHGPRRAQPWRTAAEIIDWTIPCPSIFDRERPLAEATLRRIAAGVRRYVLESAAPFVIPVTHQGDARAHDIGEPLRTVTAANRGEFALVSPTLIQTGYGERPGQAPRALALGAPLGTVVACGAKHALVAAFLTKHYGGVVGHGVQRPIGAVTAVDHHALTTAFVTKFYGTSTGSDAVAPLPTVTANGKGGGHLAEVRAFLVKYYGADGHAQGQQVTLPLHTATTRARFGLGVVIIDREPYQIVDIGMRMLQPRELFRAQGFPDAYEIAPLFRGKPLTKTMQIEKAGNSVCPPVAAALVGANVWGESWRAAA